MTDVRELMARLNPSTVKFDMGRGGIPELTNQDIAHALGLIPAGLGRDVFEACWWSDGAARRRHSLRDGVVALVMPELRRQQKRLDDARVEVGLAKVCMGWSGAVTAAQRAELERAEGRLQALKDRAWPVTTLESLPTLAAAAINEIAKRPHCECCQGRTVVILADLLVSCQACRGTGVAPISDRKRAAAIGRDEAAYRRHWKPVYEWLLAELREAEQEAAWAMQGLLAKQAA